jgi:hypothetical protein
MENIHKERWTSAPNAIHGPSGLKFQPLESVNAIASWLENQFTPHDLCDESHEGRVEARVQSSARIYRQQPPWMNKVMWLTETKKKMLNLKNVCRINGIPSECLR